MKVCRGRKVHKVVLNVFSSLSSASILNYRPRPFTDPAHLPASINPTLSTSDPLSIPPLTPPTAAPCHLLTPRPSALTPPLHGNTLIPPSHRRRAEICFKCCRNPLGEEEERTLHSVGSPPTADDPSFPLLISQGLARRLSQDLEEILEKGGGACRSHCTSLDVSPSICLVPQLLRPLLS